MKRVSKVRLILMCEVGLDVDCGPGVCARETGQAIVASKQISGKARFIWPVLNGIVCILHPVGGNPDIETAFGPFL